jgi:hypothetical protein
MGMNTLAILEKDLARLGAAWRERCRTGEPRVTVMQWPEPSPSSRVSSRASASSA